MDKKIILAVDEEEFNNIKELINEHICDGCEESYSGEYSRGVPCNNGEICLQNLFNGKAISDAEVEIARIKKELAEECLDLICGWCNGEGVTIEAGEEGQAIQVQCQYCHASGVDYNKLNMLKQKYSIGEK